MDPKKPPPLQPRFADAFFRNRESRLFRRLPGFDPAKRHKPPTERSERASAWAGRLLHETMRAELDTVYRNAKVLLGLRRRDIKLQTVDGAGGTLETKFFSYIVDAGQADTDPSEAVIERRIVLHASPHDLPDNLDQVFPVAIDEIVVPLTEDGLDFDRLVASWDTNAEHGLFTEHLLAAMYGGADQDPYGNGDGNVTVDEVKNYLDDEMTYSARREYGRRQNASIQGAGKRIVSVLPSGRPLSRPAIQKTSLQPAPAKKAALAPASPGKLEGDWEGGANFYCQDAPSWFDLAMNIKGKKITGSGSYGLTISGKVEGETDITGSIFSGLGTARFKGSLSSGKLTGNFTDSEGCRGDFELGRN